MLPTAMVIAFTTTANGLRIASLKNINYLTSTSNLSTYCSSLLTRSVRMKEIASLMGCNSSTSK